MEEVDNNNNATTFNVFAARVLKAINPIGVLTGDGAKGPTDMNVCTPVGLVLAVDDWASSLQEWKIQRKTPM